MRWRRASVCLAWAVAALFVATSAARLVPVVRDHLAATFDLMSEGPHMSTVKALERGDDIYDPRSFLDLPFYMTPYTPLYHVVVAALPQRAGNPFFTGRVVATVCMLAAAASLLFVAGRGQLPTALIALAAFFLIRAVTDNTAYLRSDALALCFSVWAVALVMRARSTRAAAAVGALCALGFAAKQSYVAAAAACCLYLLAADVRRAGWLVLGGAATGALCAAAAWATWGNGFWLAVTIPITDYPRDLQACLLHWRMMLAQPVFLAIVAIALAAIVPGWRVALRSPFLAYALLAWAAGAWVSTGVGAENHDLIEPVLATLLWIVFVARHRRETVALDWPWVLAVTVLAFAVAREMRNPDRASYSQTNPAATARYLEARAHDSGAARLRRRARSEAQPQELTDRPGLRERRRERRLDVHPGAVEHAARNDRAPGARHRSRALRRDPDGARRRQRGARSSRYPVGAHRPRGVRALRGRLPR